MTLFLHCMEFYISQFWLVKISEFKEKSGYLCIYFMPWQNRLPYLQHLLKNGSWFYVRETKMHVKYNKCNEAELITHAYLDVLNTISLFDDMQSLQLKLHVLLDHQRPKHLKIICSENRPENSLIEQENTVSHRIT